MRMLLLFWLSFRMNAPSFVADGKLTFYLPRWDSIGTWTVDGNDWCYRPDRPLTHLRFPQQFIWDRHKCSEMCMIILNNRIIPSRPHVMQSSWQSCPEILAIFSIIVFHFSYIYENVASFLALFQNECPEFCCWWQTHFLSPTLRFYRDLNSGWQWLMLSSRSAIDTS